MSDEEEIFTEDYKAIGKRTNHLGEVKPTLKPINGQYYHPFIHKIVEKLNEGKSPVVIFVGDVGTGKSMKSLRLWEILNKELNVFKDDEFEADKHLHYDVYDFLKEIEEIDFPEEQGVNPNRRCYIFDEGGVNLNSKDYHSTTNRAIDVVLQTQRMKNCLYTFILPDIQDIDKQVRKQVDYLVYVVAQGTALVSSVDVRNDWLDGSNLRPDRFPWKWQPPMPEDKHTEKYREKENERKEQFVEDYITDIEEERSDGDDSIDFDELMS